MENNDDKNGKKDTSLLSNFVEYERYITLHDYQNNDIHYELNSFIVFNGKKNASLGPYYKILHFLLSIQKYSAMIFITSSGGGRYFAFKMGVSVAVKTGSVARSDYIFHEQLQQLGFSLIRVAYEVFYRW